MNRITGQERVRGATLRYFVREAFRRLWVSRRNSFAAIALIAISLFILGCFLVVSENLRRAVDIWQGESRLTIYLDLPATPEVIRAIDGHLAARPQLERRRFITSEEALTRFKGFFSELSGVVDDLGENPFPPSFEIEVPPEIGQTAGFGRELEAIRALQGVDEVQFDWQWTSRLRSLIKLIDGTGLFLGGILALASAFTIASVIRLTMVLYREEIEIMRLVGATETIIRGPFLVEGVLQGTIGGLLAVGFLYAGFEAARQMVEPSNSLAIQFLFLTFLPWQKIVALVLGGMAAGLIGSWISLRDRSVEAAIQ
ncbi:MAG TPA: permease-like cell division protein FtsX [Thermoanaerobaculia bacterium]|nr:permease-like cell division protein FtsX [Thermoanaerobaculia bacterium]